MPQHKPLRHTEINLFFYDEDPNWDYNSSTFYQLFMIEDCALLSNLDDTQESDP